jgi:membrane fusion protein, copper/silver efflux system
MKNNIKILSIILFSIALGLALGYFLFNNKTISEEKMTHNHSPQLKDTETIWTCSMHPQIRQNEPGQCPLCGMDLITLGNKSTDDPLVLKMTADAVKLAQIQTTIIGSGTDVPGKTINLTGKIQADERQASSLVAHVPGRIEKLFVSFTGEQVKAGQRIATIYSPELIAAQKELLEAIKLQQISPDLLEATRNKLRYWKIDNSTIEAIEKNGTIRETFDIFAANSGIVTNRRVAVGDYIKQGAILFDLMNLDKIWVLFDAYEEDLKNVGIGSTITFSTPYLPNKIFKTKVTFIDPVINPVSRTAAVRAELDNKSGQLKPEMFVSGELQKRNNSSTQLTVPKTAVLWTGKRSVVYVKVPDVEIPSFQFREVELGESIGKAYLISSGLEAGEEVVTNGSFSIDAAAQLNNQISMMNQNIEIKKVETGKIPSYQESTPKAFKLQLKELSEKYILMKDDFVNTDAEKAKKAATDFVAQLELIDMQLLKGDAHILWMEKMNILKKHGQILSGLNDIEDQRKQFQFISNALIDVIKIFGIEGSDLYVQYCPMAMDNKGGDWIAQDTQIKNPYYGEKMLTCGSVKEIVKGK